MTLRFSIAKNRREILVIEATQYRGVELLSARVWYRPDDDPETLRPGREGWTIPIDRLDQLIESIREIRQALKAGEKPGMTS